jgi:hypothetical protein
MWLQPELPQSFPKVNLGLMDANAARRFSRIKAYVYSTGLDE